MPNKRIGAAAIIKDADDRVLLVKHSYGRNNWDLPGGKSEVNESAQGTAKREVLEETGLDIAVGQLTGIYYDPTYDMHHFVFLSYADGDRAPTPSSPEILECGYFSVHDLPKPINDFTCRRIQDAYAENRTDVFHMIGPRIWFD